MQFLKSVWVFLVGVKDALVLIFMLLLFAGLWAGLSMRGPTVRVPDGAALEIRLDGVLVDEATQPAPLAFLGGQSFIRETETLALVRVIDRAAEDPAIRMIALNLDGFMGGGQANLESVGQALNRFRAKDKEIEAWATAYTDSAYYLAAHAGQIGIAPMGAVALSGPGGSNLYFKDALDRLKVNVEVFRVGSHKSFVEPYTRNDASAEAKEANQQLVDDLWATWRGSVERQRPGLDIAATLASWPARVKGANASQAELAKDAGLVDTVISENAWHASLRQRLGAGDDKDRPGDFRRIDYRDYWAARRPVAETGPAVAVVHVAGTIVDGDAPPGTAGARTIRRLIEDAVADSNVKAIVVRVDSGGGSALASEEIRQAMLEARARKIPVVASFGPAAASGGYWVGTGADTIFASPATVTGSIGVFGIIPTFEGTLKQLGITTDGVKTTPFSGQPDIVGGLNDETRILIQSGAQDIYQQFLTLVATARKLPVAEVAPIAQGRVWSGTRAMDLKLVDQFGDLQAAIREAGRQAGISGEPRIKVMRQQRPILVQLLSRLEGASDGAGEDAMARAVTISRMHAVAQVEAAIAVANGPTIQAHCLTCTTHRVSGRPATSASLLGQLKALLVD